MSAFRLLVIFILCLSESHLTISTHVIHPTLSEMHVPHHCVTAKTFSANTFDGFVMQGRAVTHIHLKIRRRRRGADRRVYPEKKVASKRAFGSLTPGVHSSVSHGVTHTHIGQTGRFGVERSETLEGIWTWFTQSC